MIIKAIILNSGFLEKQSCSLIQSKTCSGHSWLGMDIPWFLLMEFPANLISLQQHETCSKNHPQDTKSQRFNEHIQDHSILVLGQILEAYEQISWIAWIDSLRFLPNMSIIFPRPPSIVAGVCTWATCHTTWASPRTKMQFVYAHIYIYILYIHIIIYNIYIYVMQCSVVQCSVM